MGFTNAAILTSAGRNLLAAAQSGGHRLRITKAQLGEGELSGNPAALTGLVAPVITDVTPKSISAPFDGRVTARFDNDSAQIPRDFWWREWGVFILDEDTGAEVLYVYNNAGEFADYVTATAGNSLILSQVLYIGEMAVGDIVVDQSIAYATLDHAHRADSIRYGILDGGYIKDYLDENDGDVNWPGYPAEPPVWTRMSELEGRFDALSDEFASFADAIGALNGALETALNGG